MLDHLGQADAAAEVVGAIEAVLAAKAASKTPDLGGNAGTKHTPKALVAALPG